MSTGCHLARPVHLEVEASKVSTHWRFQKGTSGGSDPASRETELEAAGSGSADAVLGLPKIQTPMLILSLVKSPHEPVQCFEKIRHLSPIT